MVKVACTVVNGIMIRRSKPGFDDGTGDGMKPMVHDGPGIRLNGPSALHTGAGNTTREDLDPVITEVDDEWMSAWLEQNQKNPLVTGGFVKLMKDEGENPTT